MTPEQKAALVAAAQAVREQAYAPYSQYLVGAALLGTDGRIFIGCNVESASFGATLCAERGALARAISEGNRQFEAIAITTRDGGSPCGICRQSLYEFAPSLWVILLDEAGSIQAEMPLRDLLPRGFGGESLP
ncbi:MAG: cytidine deaminase [Anaerolineae bacterium]|nr:cytidine deaminase [Anaerolineae bacterium]